MTLSLQYKRDLLDGFVKLWVYQNPYLHGPNWKCGQEASTPAHPLSNCYAFVGLRPQ